MMLLMKGNYASGERHFLRSLELDPNNALARAFYSVTCLLPLGRKQEARQEALMTNPVFTSSPAPLGHQI
jgi:hypothetical protein